MRIGLLLVAAAVFALAPIDADAAKKKRKKRKRAKQSRVLEQDKQDEKEKAEPIPSPLPTLAPTTAAAPAPAPEPAPMLQPTVAETTAAAEVPEPADEPSNPHARPERYIAIAPSAAFTNLGSLSNKPSAHLALDIGSAPIPDIPLFFRLGTDWEFYERPYTSANGGDSIGVLSERRSNVTLDIGYDVLKPFDRFSAEVGLHSALNFFDNDVFPNQLFGMGLYALGVIELHQGIAVELGSAVTEDIGGAYGTRAIEGIPRRLFEWQVGLAYQANDLYRFRVTYDGDAVVRKFKTLYYQRVSAGLEFDLAI